MAHANQTSFCLGVAELRAAIVRERPSMLACCAPLVPAILLGLVRPYTQVSPIAIDVIFIAVKFHQLLPKRHSCEDPI